MDDVRPPTPPEAPTSPPRAGRSSVLTEADRRWMAENRDAIEDFNGWYERHGSPLDKYRSF